MWYLSLSIFFLVSSTWAMLMPISHQIAMLNIQNSDVDPLDQHPLPAWTVYSNDNLLKKEDGTIQFIENRPIMDREYGGQYIRSNGNFAAGIQKSMKKKPGKQRKTMSVQNAAARANSARNRNWDRLDHPTSGSLPLIEAPVLMSNPFWKILSRVRAYYRLLQDSDDAVTDPRDDRIRLSPVQSGV